MLLYVVWRNVETSCHKHFVVVSRDQKPAPLTTSDKVSCTTCGTVSGGVVLITPGRSQRWQQAVKPESRFVPTPVLHLYWTPPLGGSRRNIAMPFGTEKLEWLGYPTVKTFGRYLYSFWQNSRTWQTHTYTDRQRMTTYAALEKAQKEGSTKTETIKSHTPKHKCHNRNRTYHYYHL